MDFMQVDPTSFVMQRSANFHEIQGFFESLNKEQLQSLEMILYSCAANPEGLVAAAHHGMVKQYLHLKHDVCTCGLDHETAEDLLGGGGEPTVSAEDLAFKEPSGAQLMEQYNLEVRPGIGLMCRGCGLLYVSLQDRMLKDPDDCHGCHLKSAQG